MKTNLSWPEYLKANPSQDREQWKIREHYDRLYTEWSKSYEPHNAPVWMHSVEGAKTNAVDYTFVACIGALLVAVIFTCVKIGLR